MQKDPLRVTAAVEPSTAAVDEFSEARRDGAQRETARIAQFKQGFGAR
jgi:hypothetical protein